MSLSADYRTYLLTKSSVTDLLGTRIYFGNLPQDPTLPAAVVNLVTSDTQRHLTNAAALARATLQIDAYADTHTAADNLAEQVRLVTEHFTGAWGSTTVRNAFVDQRRDLDDAPIDGSQAWRYIHSMDVVVWHVEALPST